MLLLWHLTSLILIQLFIICSPIPIGAVGNNIRGTKQAGKMDESKPTMNWNAPNLERERKRFRQHWQFAFDGPLSAKTQL